MSDAWISQCTCHVIEKLKQCSEEEEEGDQGMRLNGGRVEVNSNDDKIIQAQQSDGKLHDDCYISSLSEESRNLSNCFYVDMVCFRAVVVAYSMSGRLWSLGWDYETRRCSINIIQSLIAP